MSAQSRLTSKLSTLTAAQTIYGVIAGLAIKESLSIFSHDWQKGCDPCWKWYDRIIVGFGYLFTVLRFSHGVYLLHGQERARAETTTLPSSRRISWLSFFIVWMAISLYLMAINIKSFGLYVLFAALVLVWDLLYLFKSDVVRNLRGRFFRPISLWRYETADGSPARATLQWLISDVALIVICVLLGISSFYFPSLENNHVLHISLGWFLMAAAVADYWWNRALYFGGKKDKRAGKFVFICSQLRPHGEKTYEDNVNLAQLYCYRLMRADFSTGDIKITPFAPHAFYPYFLDYKNHDDRIIGRECAITFLHACDAIYVVMPYPNGGLRHLSNEVTSQGMRHVLDEAKHLGLEILYGKAATDFTEFGDCGRPVFEKPSWDAEVGTKIVTGHGMTYEASKLRKRVYVCTMLRGFKFEELKTKEAREGRLRENIRKTLWHCRQLAKEERAGETRLAPFAPQAFFPYFWKFTSDDGTINEESPEWKAWFKRSIEILKVCDAVYIYTEDGLPHNDEDISKGMREVLERAISLGLDIRYRIDDVQKMNEQKWNTALPDL